ncbi:MAG: nucleotidyltransferase domain-containing protein [Actinomycetota bacterium]|nr:nucleotidyltransferase domain-containing protein [Actinomycetota bacterium]
MNPSEVIARRRAQRAALIERAQRFAAQLDPSLGVRAVVVFGSVARGDFNYWSDVDVLVVADRLPERPLDRPLSLGDWPGGVQPVAWTSAEWHGQRQRANPIAVESVADGVWLVGSPDDLGDPNPGPAT